MLELVLLAVIAVAIGGYTLWPVLAGHRMRPPTSRTDTPLGRQELRKDLILGNIADLDFEYAMGKLSDPDYRELRDALKAQAAAVMEQIGVLEADSDLGGSAARSAAAGASAALGATAVAGEVARPGGNGHEPRRATARRFCIACGGGLPPSARFCPSCGAQVQA
jgi:hypothetical protein